MDYSRKEAWIDLRFLKEAFYWDCDPHQKNVRPYAEGIKCYTTSSAMVAQFIGGDIWMPANPPNSSFLWYLVTFEEVGIQLLILWPDPP
jgi:hypothetical protein